LELLLLKRTKLRKVEPLYVVVDLFRKAGAFFNDTIRKPVYNRMLQTLRVQYRLELRHIQSSLMVLVGTHKYGRFDPTRAKTVIITAS
jgi:hypothetical protein